MGKWQRAAHLLVAHDTVTAGEKLLAGIGCFIGILVVAWTSDPYLSGAGLTLMVASMGSSAVTLFVVPHSPFSLPWSVFGGQVVSAAVGITALYLLSDPLLTVAAAVGAAALAMHFLRCVHPPGGATAAAAALGGAPMMDLGYQFVITPVATNTLALLSAAFLLNNLVASRRYPAGLRLLRRSQVQATSDDAYVSDASEGGLPWLSNADLESALRQMNTVIDVDEEDLARIYALAADHHNHAREVKPHDVQLGSYYSNGRYGQDWSVRQIVDEPANHDESSGTELVTYRVVAGKDRRARGTCSREQFADWARYQVSRNENCWRKAAAAPADKLAMVQEG